MTNTQSINPIIYQANHEQLEENESETIQELVDTLLSISKITSEDYGYAVRSVHAKSHGLLRGKLTVKADLPAILQQGLFAKPGTYPVVMRFSTSPGDLLDDSISTPRGLAIKVLGVAGDRLIEDVSDTQDFLLVNGPAFLKPDAKGFLSSLKLLAKTTDKAEGLKKVLAASLRGTEKVLETFGGESATLKSMGGHPLTNILGETFFSQAPILYGQYMAKVSVAPVTAALTALKDAPVDLTDDPDGIRHAVSDFFSSQSAKWEIRVQLCTDIEKMPIEDSSVAWPEEESPYLTVGYIEAEPQTSWDNEISPALDEKLDFSPWHGISEHRPLGSIMRARKLAYQHSSDFRKQFNGCPMAGVRTGQDL